MTVQKIILVLTLFLISTLYAENPQSSSKIAPNNANENTADIFESEDEDSNNKVQSNNGVSKNRFHSLLKTSNRYQNVESSATETKNAGATDDLTSEGTGKVKKRSYYPYYRGNARRNVPVTIYEANSLWKPSIYQISRPYYIPVYGFANQGPIYYPPQPYPGNPGAPKDNPLKPPYIGPAYLPPDVSTVRPQRPTKPTRPGSTSDMPIIDKFDEDDDGPVWGEIPNMVPLRGEDDEEDNQVPTRPPMSNFNTFPPLVRPGTAVNRPGSSAIRPANEINRPNFVTNRPQSGARPPLPTRPAPPPESLVTTTSSTTRRPGTARLPSGPSNCVWAIISCCNAGNPSSVPEACFEQRGCGGPFWGNSPCDSEFARTAIEAAIKYYNTGGV